MDAPLPPDFDPYEIEAMNEPNWYEIALGAVMAAGAWLFKRHVGSIDKHVARIDKIEENYVTRAELDKTITKMSAERVEMRDDRLRMHQENSEALQYIRERVDKLVDRQ